MARVLAGLVLALGALVLAAVPASAQTITGGTQSVSTYSSAGQTITYTVTVNSGSRVASSATVASEKGVVYSCPIADTVNTGVTFTCTGTYTTTAGDVSALQIQERATVTLLSFATPTIMTGPVLTATYVAPPPPTVTSISPTGGPASGGTGVTINGTNFTGASAVSFGVTPATSFTVVSAIRINAVAPAGTGTVNVRVTTGAGTSATSAANQFTYVPAPTVTSITPASGPVGGGTTVVITGTNFNDVFAIAFGNIGTAQFTVDSPTQITLQTPMAAGAGTVPVRVTTGGGTSAINPAVNFTYGAAAVAPAITTNPTSATVTAGNTATFTAAASGTPTPTVQWQVSTNFGGSFSNVSGATSTTLSFATVAGDNAKQYRAVFTNSAGTAPTTAAILTVNTLPVITQQPVGATAAPGQGITMSAAATGTPTPTISWLYSDNNGVSFTALSTSNSFTLVSATARTVLMKATFTNAAGSVTSDTVSLVWAKQDQTISFTSAAPTTATVGGATYAVTATASSGLTPVFTVDAAASSVCSVSGGTVSFIGVGTCVINANQAGNTAYNAAPQVQQSFTVGQGANLITFPALSDTPFASAPPALSATASSGLAVSYVSNSTGICTVSGGTISFVAGGTCSITASQAGNANYVAATSVTQTFAVTQSPNIITFPALSNTPFTSAPPALSATASSGLTVSYASTTSGVCSVTSGGAISFIAAGTCSITANQAGNTTYAAAAPVTQTFDVTLGANTITFPPLANTPFTSAPPALSASASSGLTVSYASNSGAVCTVSGGAISFVAAGTCSITASQAGNSNFAAATPITQTFEVTPGVNTITFPALASTAFTSAPPALAATASSGLAVSYGSNSGAVCTVSGGTISFVAAGTCSITASQAGNANYAAANSVTNTFEVTPGVNTITFAALPNRALGSGSFGLTATASSGLAVAFSTSTPTICSVSGTTVNLLTVGTCTVLANQAGNANYQAAPQVSQSFQVTQAVTTVGLTSSASTAFFGTPVTLTATVSGVSPTGSVQFNDGATVLGTSALSGGTASFTTSSLAAGTHSLTATYLGDARNLPGTSAAISVTVNARPNPAQDPDTRSSVDSQFRMSERFVRTQMDNVEGRLDQLHNDGEDQDSMNLRFSQTRPQWRSGIPGGSQNLQGGTIGYGYSYSNAQPASGGEALLAMLNPNAAWLPGAPMGMAPVAMGGGNGGDNAGTHRAAGESLERRLFRIWASGDINFGKEQPNGGVEQRFTSTGITVGMDGKFSSNLKLGAAFGFGWDNARIGTNGSENDATNGSLTFYGSWRVAPKLFIDGLVGQGYGTINTTRFSTTGAVFLDGKRRTSQTYAALIGTYEGKLGNIEFAPYLRADGIWVHLSPYTETGSPFWALAFAAADENSFSATVGAKARFPLGKDSGWKLTAKGEYRTRISGDYTQLLGYADLQGTQGTPYAITGQGVDDSTFTGGLGLEGNMRNLMLRLGYDLTTMAGGNISNRISAAIGWKF
ncbi:MAG: hypothetical protein RL299_2297 [Pseudomonadota bacterium]